MKKISFMLVLLLSTINVMAQRQTEYNRKGDEAMESLDYSSAKIWYEMGVVERCDSYSISQLTIIWQADSSMHTSMRSVMSKCLACLDGRATEDRDTSSIKTLILYYTEGIGTYKNETKVNMWQSKLKEIRNPYKTTITYVQETEKPPREKVKMQFFAGYAATFEAPFGITVGGVGRTVGWYLRFRTNLSFQSFNNKFDLDSSEEPIIIGGLNDGLPYFSGRKKVNSSVVTGGIIFNVAPSFYLSLGGGYCVREYLIEYQKIDIVEANIDLSGPFWAKSDYSDDTSFSGVALDLDGTFKIGKSFYGSLGCTMFDFKYISTNAGIGVFF